MTRPLRQPMQSELGLLLLIFIGGSGSGRHLVASSGGYYGVSWRGCRLDEALGADIEFVAELLQLPFSFATAQFILL